jgi:hypothetical protein
MTGSNFIKQQDWKLSHYKIISRKIKENKTETIG